MKTLRRSKDRNKSTIKRKLEKDLWHFAEGNKDTDGSVDYVRWREVIIYFQKKNMHSYMKQELGGRYSYDPLKMMKYISMVEAMKDSMFSVQTQTKYSLKRILKVSLVVHPHR